MQFFVVVGFGGFSSGRRPPAWTFEFGGWGRKREKQECMRAREREVEIERFVANVGEGGLMGIRRTGRFGGRLEREKKEQRDRSKEREGKKREREKKRYDVMHVMRVECASVCVCAREREREREME